MGVKYDFGGYATRNDIKCTDGRTIRKDAFVDNDGQTVPLVWQHMHDDPMNVLGHALLENRDDGVYAYCAFNDTDAAAHAKEAVKHGDIRSLSIYANQLKQSGGNVLHGQIREVSLVLAGANKGAYIDTLVLEHSDGTESEVEDEGIIYYFQDLDLELEHEDKEDEEVEDKDTDYEAILDSLTDNQKKALVALAKYASGEDVGFDEDEVSGVVHSMNEEQQGLLEALVGKAHEEADDNTEEEEDSMKHNLFDGSEERGNTLSHADMEEILRDAKNYGSLRESFLAHADGDDSEERSIPYGINNIDWLFPEDRYVNDMPPEFIKRNTDWVAEVMSGVHHTPFSRIKSMFADITADEARAKGYVKGNRKTEEIFGLLKRRTGPQTVYKKQKLDRDDIIDITDFNVVSWIKSEMRLMLDEELARAYLIGDGRPSSSDDKIDPLHIRPIYTDSTDVFTINTVLKFANGMTDDQKAKAVIRAAVKSRKGYKGSGNPVCFTTEDWLTDMLLLEDGVGHRLYKTEQELATALRVRKIVTVPVMEGQTRIVGGKQRGLIAIIVNLNDYTVGADKGGAVSLFEDFDIDYNQEKYLIETRCSGALTKPFSAIIIENEIGDAPADDDDEGDDSSNS